MTDLDYIAIDENHINLIYGIIISHKPKSILELGIGSGYLTKKILSAFEYNNIDTKNFDCVDNFYDWHYTMPDHIKKIKGINLIMSNEEAFIKSCVKKYDMIISDADHFNCHKWINETCSLLSNNGILIYHDVTNNSFTNLKLIIDYFKSRPYKYSSLLFNKNSRDDERCDRGLLITQKLV